MDPLYHVGDSIMIKFYKKRLVGNIIAYPTCDFLVHELDNLTGQPSIHNYGIIFEDDRYRNQIYYTNNGEVYAFNTRLMGLTYLYIIQLSTGQTEYTFENHLIPISKELLTRTISGYNIRRKEFNRMIRNDTVAAIALGTKMPLDINRHIASLTLSRKAGGRKKKTRKTRKTRK